MGFFSKIWKSIKKVFKKVVNVVKKVAPYAAAAAAVFFTAGSALSENIPSWGQASASIVESLGFEPGGLLSDTLVGAVTQAGYGAAIGGVTGAITGQGFGRGAAIGGAIGGVTGGVTGFVNSNASLLGDGVSNPGLGIDEGEGLIGSAGSEDWRMPS